MLSDEKIREIAYATDVPARVLKAMYQTESGKDMDKLFRFEPLVYRKITRKEPGYAKYYTDDKEERIALATSWGVGHVMGYNYRHMGYKFDLEGLTFDLPTSAWYAAKMLKLLYDRSKASSPEARDRWETAIQRYNTGGVKKWPAEHIKRYRGYYAKCTIREA